MKVKEKEGKAKDAFLEELIIRRELSMNFVHYNERYNQFESLPSWCRQTLKEHEKDRREYIYSNNKYELDGRDPNGFAGVCWCFGKHDRPWPKRSILGKVRTMKASGLLRKFDADAYVRKIDKLTS